MILRSTTLKSPFSFPTRLSNRIVLLALTGIFFLTLFPFHFVLQGKLLPGSSPFLLGTGEKADSALNIFLNIFLFVPFGFGLSERLHEKGWSWRQSLFATWIVGALTSYSIEFLQIYIPARDSGWEDVVTNGAGAALGSLFFTLCGRSIIDYLLRLEQHLRASLTLRRAIVILSIYFALWFVVSALLQKQTRLADWSPQSRLYLAGEPQIGAAPHWKGTVSALKMWNLALSDQDARTQTSGEVPDAAKQSLVASYDFSSYNRIQDQLGLLPELSWSPHPPPLADVRGAGIRRPFVARVQSTHFERDSGIPADKPIFSFDCMHSGGFNRGSKDCFVRGALRGGGFASQARRHEFGFLVSQSSFRRPRAAYLEHSQYIFCWPAAQNSAFLQRIETRSLR